MIIQAFICLFFEFLLPGFYLILEFITRQSSAVGNHQERGKTAQLTQHFPVWKKKLELQASIAEKNQLP